MVPCKKYPVSESASLDPLAPIHIFQHQFPGTGEIFITFFFIFHQDIDGHFDIFYGRRLGCVGGKMKKSLVYMTENV